MLWKTFACPNTLIPRETACARLRVAVPKTELGTCAACDAAVELDRPMRWLTEFSIPGDRDGTCDEEKLRVDVAMNDRCGFHRVAAERNFCILVDRYRP